MIQPGRAVGGSWKLKTSGIRLLVPGRGAGKVAAHDEKEDESLTPASFVGLRTGCRPKRRCDAVDEAIVWRMKHCQ